MAFYQSWPRSLGESHLIAASCADMIVFVTSCRLCQLLAGRQQGRRSMAIVGPQDATTFYLAKRPSRSLVIVGHCNGHNYKDP